ncbi:MAG TPA: calcium-binding protein [Tepidisphaeraceae bacterium]|nr:calcium-binding protein [Tepidisphaeraceae bacterium]
MSRRHSSRDSRARMVRSSRAAIASVVETLERRVLLSTVLPNSAALNTGVQGIVQTPSQLQDAHDEIDSIDQQLSKVIGDLPLVGNAMSGAIHTANDAFNGVSAKVQSALSSLSSDATIHGTDIQNVIFAALGPSGLNILPASVASASDVPIQLVDTDGNTANGAEQVNFNLELQGNLFTASLNPKFDIGLPGLKLGVTSGTIQAQATYDIKLNIDANATDGLYIDLTPNPEVSLKLAVTAPGLHVVGNLGFLQLDATDGSPGNSPTQHTQLVGTISADLSVGGDEKLTASNLGSLVSNSSLDASAEADVHLHSVLSFGGSAEFPSLQADLDMTWSLANASLNSGGVTDSSFGSEPDIHFNNIQLDVGSFFSKFVTPIVSEMQTILKPLQPIIDLLNTRMPIFSDIGFLENKFDTNHDGKVSLLEVLNAIAPQDTTFLNTVVGIDNLINSVPSLTGDALLNLGSFELGGSSNANGADIRSLTDLTGINLSNFNADDIASEMTALGNSIGGSVGAQVGSFLGTIADNSVFGGGGGSDGAGLQFPILQNPSSAFKLLLGQNVDLFTFDTPTLDVKAPLDVFFSILGPLGVELKGTVDADDTLAEFKAHLDMGYDTSGLVEFATTDSFNPAKIGDLFDGFFVLDDPTKTYAEANVGIGAFAAIDIVVASAGVGGGINGDVTMTVNDPNNDGKLRPKEILQDLQMSPLCLFNIDGTITASLDAYIKVGFDTPFGFVGWQDNFTLASATLLDFSAGCSSMPSNPPTLATLLSSGSLLGPAGTLRLNMGPYASDRGTGDVSDDDEDFSVVPISQQSDGSETVDVEAFGYVQQYAGVRKIYAEGGNGNDKILIQPGVESPVELWGDFNPSNPDNGGATAAGDDTLGASDGPATLHGGDGNDQLTAGNGAAFLYGDGGTDLLVGGPGNDYLDGGDGDDSPSFTTDSNGNITGGVNGGLYGMGGNDTLVGGNGNDYLDGGSGNDSVDGGSGDDTLHGGDGNDTVTADDGNDVVIGDLGDDSLDGGTGNDLLVGDSGTVTDNGAGQYVVTLAPGGGNDTLLGGDGNDTLYGGDGNDSLSGGTGNDYMQGNAGNDTLDGGDGNDTMIGGQGNDSMTGDAGNDVMLGDDGDVDSFGNVTLNNSATDGNDTMDGGDGNDLMYGQGGNDVMTGDAGNDSMVGGQGNDWMSGGDDNDIMLGDDGTIDALGNVTQNSLATDGNDSMIGGGGNDAMYGQGGNDIMLGDNGSVDSSGNVTLNNSFADGSDTLDGGDGNDLMYGQGGNDSMTGDAGNDSMVGGQGNDSMDGGAGNDIMLGDDGTIASNGTITLSNSLTDGADSMSGSDGNDEMYGQGGNDTMSGGAGDDDMVGGQGNDSMDGGDGNDAMLGDDGLITRSGTIFNPDGSVRTDGRVITLQSSATDGSDTMTGGNGNDTMYGQGGNDSMSGGNDDDDMVGGLGNDTMDGGAGNDVMLGDEGTISTPVNVVPKAVPESNSIARSVTLNSSASDGNDSMTGGDGNDTMYGQGGNDWMDGNAGDDYMEGNSGNDTMFGEAGDDDMIGGSSVAFTPDGNDSMDGGDGNDVMLGDNGIITRPTDASGTHYLRQTPGATPGTGVGLEDNAVIRTIILVDSDSVGGNDTMTGGTGDDIMHGELGNDVMYGGDGNDQMFGELGNDFMDGGAGNDCMLGDDGTIVGSIFNGASQTTLTVPGNKVSAVVDVKGTIDWMVNLLNASAGGNDTIIGGLGNDVIHGGAGNDITLGDQGIVNANGTVSLIAGGGNDILFADSGNDRVYGGDGNDQIFGGTGGDYLDGGNGADIVVGGEGADTLVADNSSDRLIDWYGNSNLFIVPGPGYGAPVIIRSPDPHMQDFLISLATADGSVDPEAELALIFHPGT